MPSARASLFTLISGRLTVNETAYIVADCGAKLIVTSYALRDTAAELLRHPSGAATRLMVDGTIDGYDSYELSVQALPPIPIADQSHGRDMLYSSGTTGRPKGVVSSFKLPTFDAQSPMADLCEAQFGMSERTIYLSPAPLYHAAPLRFSMTVMRLGGTVVVMEHFDPLEFLRLVERHRVTHTQLVPTMFVRMLKLPQAERNRYDLTSLECAIHAAAPCPIAVKEQMIEWWGPILFELYAGTEGNGMTVVDSHSWLAHKGTVGRAVAGKVKICDAHGEELPANQVGAVYFAEGNAFAYHNDPIKTAESRNENGWSTLGDIGYVDEEGFLYLTDRKAHMIISGGVNIYPQECENLLVTHPQVLDAAVFGVPNEEFGEEVKAVVQLCEPGEAGKRAGGRVDCVLPRAPLGDQVPALDRLCTGAAAQPDGQAAQARPARSLLGGTQRASWFGEISKIQRFRRREKQARTQRISSETSFDAAESGSEVLFSATSALLCV